MRRILYFIAFLILWLCFYLFVYSKYTLLQFQNGKLGQYRPKNDQDTRNLVRIPKLKNNSFCSKLKSDTTNNTNTTYGEFFAISNFSIYFDQFWPKYSWPDTLKNKHFWRYFWGFWVDNIFSYFLFVELYNCPFNQYSGILREKQLISLHIYANVNNKH